MKTLLKVILWILVVAAVIFLTLFISAKIADMGMMEMINFIIAGLKDTFS